MNEMLKSCILKRNGYRYNWVAIILVAVILLFRCYNFYLFPPLLVEDGVIMFGSFFNDPRFCNVFRYYTGYICFIPELVAYLGGFLPVRLIPYVYSLWALTIAATAFSCFTWRRFRVFLPDDRDRLIICLLLAAYPLGNGLLLTNMAYSLWNLLLLLLLLAIAPMPRRGVGLVLQTVFMLAVIWSHGMSFIIVPICLFNIFRRYRDCYRRLVNILLIAGVFSYIIWGIRTSVAVRQPPDLILLFKGVTGRIAFETLTGNSMRLYFYQHDMGWIASLIGTLLLIGLAVLAYRGGRKIFLITVGGLAAMVVFTALSISIRGMPEFKVMGYLHHRYFYLSTIGLLASFLVIVCRLSHLRQRVKITVFGLVLLNALVLNCFNDKYFNWSREYGIGIAKLMRKVEELQRQGYTGKLVFQRGIWWDISLDFGRRREILGDRTESR